MVVLVISEMRDINIKLYIFGKTLHQSSSVYTTPIKSEVLGIQCHHFQTEEIVCTQPADILCKALVYFIEGKFYSFPILHSKEQ